MPGLTQKRQYAYFELKARIGEFCYHCNIPFLHGEEIVCLPIDGRTFCNTECLKEQTGVIGPKQRNVNDPNNPKPRVKWGWY